SGLRRAAHPSSPWPVRASPRLTTGVTEPGGPFWLAPLGNGDRRRYSPARFVHDPELVCSRGFHCGELRKHSPVGLVTSYQRRYLHDLSTISVPEPGQGRAVGRVTRRGPPTKPPALAGGPLTGAPPVALRSGVMC